MLNTTQKITFKPHYTVRQLDKTSIILITEHDRYFLRGHVFALIANLLSGAHSTDEIVAKLLDKIAPEKTYHALMLLEREGHIIPAKGKLSKEQSAYWSSIGLDAHEVTNKLSSIKIAIRSVGCNKQDVKVLSSSLARIGIKTDNVKNSDLVVAITNDYLHPELEKLNRSQYETNKPLLIMKPVGQILWLGPLITPEENNGCWQCLAYRLKENRPIDMVILKDELDQLPIAEVALPMSRNTGIELAATEIAKWVALGRSQSLAGNVVTLDLDTLETHHHQIHKQPLCPTCSGEQKSADERLADAMLPLQLNNQHKGFTDDGGHRICAPETTLQILEQHVSPITGIIPGLNKAKVSGPVHVYYAKHTFPMNVSLSENRRIGKPSWAAGKGATEVQAKVSCMAEAIERYSAGFQTHEPVKSALYSEIAVNAIHPEQLAHFSEAQYTDRDDWNAKQAGFNWIPNQFDESRGTDWTPNWSLTHNCVRWVPSAYCYLNYPQPDDYRFYQGDANGCASGNTVEEAILQGFFELVERDAMAIWWYNRLQRHPIDIGSFDVPYFVEMKKYYASRGRTLEAIDISSDLGICSVVAISWVVETGGFIQVGLGTHLDAKVSISRALSELNQLLAHDDTESHISDPHVRDWFQTATCKNQPYMVADDSVILTADDYPKHYSDDLLTDVETCVALAKKQDLEVLVLNLTRADVNFPTVRVTIPGLRHFWSRTGPGRLYDVPVKMGWLSSPNKEEDLNPTPFFL